MDNAKRRSGSSNGQSAATTKVAAGAVVGAAAAMWAGKRIRDFSRQERPAGMVDWNRAVEIALRMNKESALTATERAELSTYYSRLVEACVPLITEYTCLLYTSPSPRD